MPSPVPAQPGFPMNISVPEARQMLADLLPAPQPETVPVGEAAGRYLYSDLEAKVSHPSATESALDGIACREADTLSASSQTPTRLKVVGESRAGVPFMGSVSAGECVRIYTGAPVPEGADAICPVEQLEDVQPGDDGEDDAGTGVLLLRPASRGDVRAEGGDFRVGEVVLRAGQRLTPARLALAESLGHAEVVVRRKLRVAVLSTGDEVREPGSVLSPGQVYDSNRYGLSAMIREAGADVIDLGHSPDSPEVLAGLIDGAGGADVLLTSGGVSMGKYDFMRDLLLEQGRVSFWKVRLRPGGPAMLGGWRGLPVFGLPGNPVSSLVVFQVIVRPALTGEPPFTLRLRAATPFRAIADKAAYWRGNIHGGAVSDYGKQGSGVLRSLSDTGALVIVPEGQPVEVGDEVEVMLF